MDVVFLHHRADGTVKILDATDPTSGEAVPRIFSWYADACFVLQSLGLRLVGARVNNLETWSRES